MKRRICALLTALALLSTLGIPAAAVQNSTENFVRTKTYAGEFSDVAPGSAFYDNAAALYEYGLSVGKGDGTFGLKDAVTVGQLLIFAGRIRSLYATGDAEAGPNAFRREGAPAFERYLLYLEREGAAGLSAELGELAPRAATRAQTAHILAAALPAGTLDERNGELVTQGYASRRYITDVTEYTPYYQEILALYKTGISVGSDELGSFYPDRPITRGAAAAMLTRMVDPALRLTPAWTAPEAPAGGKTDVAYESAVGATWGSLAPDAAYIAAPATGAELAQDVAYMLRRESNVLTLHYAGGVDSAAAGRIMQAALDEVKSYCEQLYNTVNCTSEAHGGTVTLTFSALAAQDRLEEYRTYTLASAIAVHDALRADGTITADMTETEKARAYFTWVCDNCTYDAAAGDASTAHLGWSLFHDGTAVCDGYTGAYNLLLKLEGIACYARSNAEHIWTVATLDGRSYHIDTTWGDAADGIQYSYFAMSEDQSRSIHPW